jgi:hypothetical protein
MNIVCVLSDKQLNNLYKHVYKSMTDSSDSFDLMNYMRDLFQKIKQTAVESGVENPNIHAAKFVQIVPRIVADIAMNNLNIDIDLNSVRNAIKTFEETSNNDLSKGLNKAIQELNYEQQTEMSAAALKALYETRFKTSVNPNNDNFDKDNFTLKPEDPLTSTNQELIPNEKDSQNLIEKKNKSNELTYNVIKNLKENAKLNDQGELEFIYDGIKVYLKGYTAQRLNAMHIDPKEPFKLHPGLAAEYAKSLNVKIGGRGTKDTHTIDRHVLVFTDSTGNILFFDQEGNISTQYKEKYYPVVNYQRIIEKSNGEYLAKNHEGEASLQTPEEIAKKNIELTLEEIKAFQQQKLKELNDFQKSYGKEGSEVLEILNLSKGALVSEEKRIVSLSEFAQDLDLVSVLSTLRYYDAPIDNFISGQSSVEVKGERYLIKTPYLNEETAQNIIDVLSDPNISIDNKLQYHNQFVYDSYNINSKNPTQKHYIVKKDGKLYINYKEKGKRQSITISNKETLSEDIKNKLKELLLNPFGEDNPPVRMHFSLSDVFLQLNNGKLQTADLNEYFKFLSKLNLEIDTINDLVNSYIHFKIPKKEVSGKQADPQPADQKTSQDRSKANPEEVNVYQEIKDKIVEKLRVGETLEVLSVDKPLYSPTGFDIDIKGIGETIFYNHEGSVDITKPGNSFTLNLTDITKSDGTIIKDVVEVLQDGKKVGQIRVSTDEEFAKESTKKESTTSTKTTSDAKQATDSTTTKQSDNQQSDTINGETILFRTKKLFNKASKDQVKAAEEWWANSPLNKFIDFNVLADVVNSDAFAKFIIDGSTLASPEMLAKIELYKDGSMLDMYHEAWHGFSQLFLNKQQKKDLYDEVRNSNKKYAEYSNLQVEELLAEDFRSYAKKQKATKGSPKRNTIFRKIWNFLKTLFGKVPKINSKRIANNPNVKELYEKLYFASKDPNLLAEYKPSLENVMFGEMNRAKAISSVTAGKRYTPVMSVSDSTLISQSIDSIISEKIDERLEQGGNPALTLAILRGKNRSALYNIVRKELKAKLDGLKEELTASREKEGNVNSVKFNSITTEKQLEKISTVVITRKDDTKAYGILSSQLDNLDNLYADLKKGDKVKGQVYHNINIVTDFYKHKTIKHETGDKKAVPIIVANNKQELIDQFINFKEDPVSNTWKDIEVKDTVLEPLTTEQSKIQNNINLLELALSNFGDGNSGVIKYHLANTRYAFLNAEKLSKLEETDEEGNDIYESDIQEATDDFADRKVGKKSVWDTAHPEIKYLVSSLHAVDKTTGEAKVNKLGFKELADYGNVWGHMVKGLSGIQDPQAMLEALANLANPTDTAVKTAVPELKQLIKKLPSYTESYQTSDSFDTISALFHSFNKTTAPYLQTTFIEEEPGKFTAHVLTSSVKEAVVITNWSNKFKFKNVSDDPNSSLKVDDKGVRYLDLQTVINNYSTKEGKLNQKFNKGFYFLQDIGIKLDDLISIKTEIKDKDTYYGAQYIFNALKYAADIEQKSQQGKIKLSDKDIKLLENLKRDPVSVLNSEYTLNGKTFNNKTNIKRLAELHAEKGIETFSQGVPNAAGDTVFPQIENNAVTRIVNALNNGSDLSKVFKNNPHISYLDPSVNPYTTRLKLLNSLYNTVTGEKIIGSSIDAFMNSGTQIIFNQLGNQGVNTTDLDGKSYLLQNIHSMLLAGVQELPRHASKKTSMGMKASGRISRKYTTITSDAHLYIPTEGFTKEEDIEDAAIRDIIIPHIAAEFDRIRRVRNNKEKYKNYSGYNNPITYPDGKTYLAGELFTAFDNVLSKNTKKKLYALNTEEFSNVTLEQILNNEKFDLADEIVADVKNYFKEMSEDILENVGTEGFIATNLLERTGLDLTLPGNREKAKSAVIKSFAYNSFIHNFETAILVYGDMAQYNHIKEELHKRNTGSTSGGPGFRSDAAAKEFINSALFTKDSYSVAEFGSFYRSYNGVLKTGVVQDNIVEESIYLDDIKESLKDYYLSIGKTEAEADKLVEEDADPYKGMEEGDGAGYINIDSYRMLKKLENDWSEAQEDLFKKMVNKEELNPAEVIEMFPPYKLQNFGHLANQDLPSLSMHKFALFPLIPNVIKNSDLEVLHKRMLKSGTDYVTFKSGSKGVTITSDGKPDRLYDENGKIISKGDFTNNPVYVEYLKKSSSVNHYFKGKTVYPTQKRGLLLNHLYDQGFAYKGDKELESLAQNYIDLVSQYSAIVKLELLEEIGYSYDAATDSYVGDHRKFLELVNDALESRDVPKHLLDSIKTDINGNVENDLSYHIKADKIEQVLVSLIEKRLIKQEVKGEPLVQMPATMFNGIWDQTPEVLSPDDPKIKSLIGTNNLPFYNKDKKRTGAMHISIALQGPFLNLLEAEYNGKKIGDIDTLNVAIKDPEWLKDNEDLVTIVGDRIPIQDHGSLEVAKIHHFLPANMSNIVVVPTEMVAKAGSDFDVDKIFWQFPEINKSGKLVTSEYSVEELDKMLNNSSTKAEAKKQIRNKKKAINNELIKANADILLSPKIYPYLIKPNNTYLWTGLAKDMEKYYDDEYTRYKNYHNEGDRILLVKGKKKRVISPTRTLEPLYQVHKLTVNMVGKDGLGIIALENKIHPILKSVGMKMPKEITLTLNGKYTPVKLPFSLMFNHNKTKDGNISLSNDLNVNGVKIADLNSHLMNGLVDVEKDAWVFYVRANIEQLPTMNFLIQSGVSEDQLTYFLSQPLIREYINEILEVKSMYYTLSSSQGEPKAKWQIYGDLIEKTLGKNNYELLLKKANARKQAEILNSLKDTDLVTHGNKEITVKEFKTIFKNAYSKGKILPFIHNNTAYKYTKNLSNTLVLPFVEKELKESLNIEELDNEILNKGLEKKDPWINALALTHYLNLGNQIRSYGDAKQLFNPDTNVSKSANMSFNRNEALRHIKDNPNVDRESIERLENQSILSSFFSNDVSNKILKSVFNLRLNPNILNYMNDVAFQKRSTISSLYGRGAEGKSKFFANYSNAVINTIFQNNMSYNMDDKGNIQKLPETYGPYDVIVDNKISKLSKVESNQLLINTDRLDEMYNDQRINKIEFPNLQLFYKYYLELAVQKHMYPNKSDQELRQRAKIFSFNPTAMLTSNSGYSVKLLDLINNTEFINDYSILKNIQIADFPSRKGYNLLTLANKRDLSADEANEYASQLRQLADPTVMKVKNKEKNYEISEYFSIFTEALIYQHGVGYSINGIVDVLPQKELLAELALMGDKFINNQLNHDQHGILNYISDTLLKRGIKNYVVPVPEQYNNPEFGIKEIQDDEVSGINISSNSKGLGGALTNPTEIAKSKGNITQSYPVEFNGKSYKDVETAYQALKDKSEAKTKPSKDNSKNYKLMVDLITAKLQQHPRLVNEITKQGGSAWILSSTHQPTNKNTVWETGGQNWFIEALNDAYFKLTDQINSEFNSFTTIENIIDAIPEIISVKKGRLPSGIGGSFNTGGNIPFGKGEIILNENNTEEQNKESLAHELVHGILQLRYKESLNPNPKIEHKNIGSKYEHYYATYNSYGAKLGKRFNTKEEAENYIKDAKFDVVPFKGSELEKELKDIWKNLPKQNINPILIDYINKNVEELITYTLTNPNFAQTLNKIQYKGEIEEYKGKTIFQVIIDLFSKIIPVKGSAYDKVLSVLNNYSNNINFPKTFEVTPSQFTIKQNVTNELRALTLEEQKLLNNLPKLTAQIKTKSGKTLLSLGITNPEWESLTDLEKVTLLNCN